MNTDWTCDPKTCAVLDVFRTGLGLFTDVEIAMLVGVEPVRASRILRWLAARGIVTPV